MNSRTNQNETEIHASGTDGRDENILVGEKVRDIRTQHGLTLKTLAEKSKLNINTLSMIEKGKTSPSVGTLQRLAKAMNVPITDFFESGFEEKKIVFMQKGKRPEVSCCGAKIQNLGKDIKNGTLEPFMVIMPKDAGSGGRSLIHNGFEFAYCVSGKILYSIEEEQFTLESGDSLLFPAQYPHRWENINNEVSEFLLVLTPVFSEAGQGRTHFHETEDA